MGSDFLNKLCLRGKISSGAGEGARFVSLPWVRKQMAEKLGFTPFPGTLDIMLGRDSVEVRKSLMKASGIEILPAPGYFRGKLFRAKLRGAKCALVVPEVLGYPDDIIEIVAPANLRDELRLVDGSLVEVEVTV